MFSSKVIAHRGGRVWAPENTLSAFRRSLELGVHGIELDVQRCASGELVVFHDEDLARTTNGAGLIEGCSFDELRRLSAGKWFDAKFDDERVPLLSEVLELLQGKVMLNVELKNTPVQYDGIEDDLLEAIDGYPTESLIVSSFDHKVLYRLHQKAPALKIAVLADCVFVDLLSVATAVGAQFLHPSFDSLRPDVMDDARACGLQVNVWTCNTPKQWRECLRLGVDGIITDDPQSLKRLLADMAATIKP